MQDRWRILRHILLIIPLISTFFPQIDLSKRITPIPNQDQLMMLSNWVGAVMLVTSLLIIYVNIYVFVPRFLFKDKFLFYTLILFGMALLYYIIEVISTKYIYDSFEKYLILPKFVFKDFINETLLPLVFLGSTTGYKIFKKWIIDNERLNEMRNSQLKEELNHLKNQVNPHFLFNTLNNLGTLIQTDTEKATQVVHGLSDVLKYQIYDSSREQILLSKDIAILSQLLLLEKIRRDRFTYELWLQDNIDGILIPPLLFINFIDNALKHSLDNREASYLKIKIAIIEKRLEFYCENSKPSFIVTKETGGIGLKNITRRLELLYGSTYTLNLQDEPNKFSVYLTIPI